MKYILKLLLCMITAAGDLTILCAQTDTSLKIFQFPPNQIPRIDDNTENWLIVPEDYYYGTEYLVDDEKIHAKPDAENLNVRICVGWVKGVNRLYFLYEAYDNYWDFSRTDLHHDILEVVVDGDRSGGPLIDRFHLNQE